MRTSAVPHAWTVAAIAAVFAAAWPGAALLQEALPSQRFRVGVQGVRVNVLATHRGVPISGLTKDDFILLDNGVPQEIAGVRREEMPLAVTLALDTSGSLDRTKLDQLIRAATALLQMLDSRDSVTLLTFERRLRLLSLNSEDIGGVVRALSGLRSGGGTSLLDATYAGLTLQQPAEVHGLLLVFTDGADTTSWLEEGSVLSAARSATVVAYGVTVPHGEREPAPFARAGPPAFLDKIAAATGGRTMSAEWNRLDEAFTQIVSEFKHRYLLTYTPRNVPPDGWHTLEVKLKGRPGDVRHRRGYLSQVTGSSD